MPTLVYSDVDGVERAFPLGREPVTIGRAVDCTIRSDDPRMSRQHARISWTDDGVWVEDLGSSNGVYVGLDRVQRGQRALVPVGELLVVGSIVMQLAPTGSTLPPPMGTHGTLAQWLSLERKSRRALEDERNAFASRVGEMHEERSRASEHADAELARVRNRLDEAEAARRELADELDAARRELEVARARDAAQARIHASAVEHLRAELARAEDDRAVAEASVGVAEAAARAEHDRRRAALEDELARVRQAALDAERAHADERERLEQRAAAATQRPTTPSAPSPPRGSSSRRGAPRRRPPSPGRPAEPTGMSSPSFKTIRMQADEPAPADAGAAAPARRHDPPRRGRRDHRGGAVARSSRPRWGAPVTPTRAQKLDRELAAAAARIAAAERRAENAASAAALEVAQARRAQTAATDDARTTSTDEGLTGFEGPETTASAAVALDAHADLAARLAETEDEARRLEDELRAAHSELRELRVAPSTQPSAKPLPDPVPADIAAQLDVLEEAIDSLRANLRAAADELGPRADAAVALDALAQADGHLQRGRTALAEILAWSRAES
ncbi:MAG: FHA domain-containing protein [Kofleriaceae bacterium]